MSQQSIDPSGDHNNEYAEYHALIDKKHYALVITRLSQRTQTKMLNYEEYILLGNLHIKEGNFMEAIDCYEKAIKLNPRASEAHYFLGLAFKQSQRNKEAENHLRRVIDLNPAFWPAIYMLCDFLQEQGLRLVCEINLKLVIHLIEYHIKNRDTLFSTIIHDELVEGVHSDPHGTLYNALKKIPPKLATQSKSSIQKR